MSISSCQTLRASQVCTFFGMLLTASASSAQPAANERAVAEPATELADQRRAARASFERGLTLARDGHYAEAKAAFLAAYAVHPHYLVLYNVAQADRQLGNLDSAIAYLERFLREGAASVSAEQRAGASEQIAELRAQLSSNAAVPPPDHAPAEEHRDAVGLPEPAPEGAAAKPADPTWLRAPAPRQTIGQPWGSVLGISGGVLLGVATGLYVWNDGRHGKWGEARQRLDALPNRDEQLRTDLSVWQQAKSNNELLASIQRVDVLALVVGGVGALALGAGAWAVLAEPPRDSTLVASGTTLTWRTTW